MLKVFLALVATTVVAQLCPPLLDDITTLPTGITLTDEGCYNTSAVTSMDGMFRNSSIDYYLTFDISSVTSMREMFAGASQFSRDISDWDVSKVTDFTDMFAGTRMATEVTSGVHYTTPCLIHTAWKGISPAHWDPQVAGLPSLIADAFCAPYLPEGPLLCPRATEYVTTLPTGVVAVDGGCYNTSAVTSTVGMFSYAAFNHLFSMDTSKVTNMNAMFSGAGLFNQPLAWDVRQVVSFTHMFLGVPMSRRNACFIHNTWKVQTARWNPSSAALSAASDAACAPYVAQLCPPLVDDITTLPTGIALTDEGCYNTSAVTSMDGMFRNSTIDYYLTFDVSAVTSMREMFAGASQFSRDLSEWDVSKVTDFTDMFAGTRMATEVTSGVHYTTPCLIHTAWKGINPAHWDPQVAGLSSLIADAFCAPYLPEGPHLCPRATEYVRTLPTGVVAVDGGCYNTSAVTSTYQMFFNVDAFNHPFSMDTSKVTNMDQMFRYADGFNQPLSLDTSKVRTMGSMFEAASSFNQPLAWDVRQVTSFGQTFFGAPMSRRNACFIHNTWKVQTAVWDPSTARLSAANDAACAPYVAQLCPPLVDDITTLPTGIALTDEGCYNTSAVTSMDGMFRNSTIDYYLTFDVSAVTSMREMFAGASQFSRDLSEWDVSKVTDFTDMFAGTRMATEVTSGVHYTTPCLIHTAWKGINPAHWDPQVAGLSSLIADAFCAPYLPEGPLLCPRATEYVRTLPTGVVAVDGGCYNTSAVTSTYQMFIDVIAFNHPFSMDTSKVTNMNQMFRRAYRFNQPLSLDTSKVRTMDSMFESASSFNQPLAWDVRQVTSFGQTFIGAPMSRRNACFIHNTWKVQNARWDPSSAYLGAASDAACAPYVAQLCPPLVDDITTLPTGIALTDEGCYNTSAVTSTEGMFRNSTIDYYLTLDTSSVTSMREMFAGASRLEGRFLHYASEWDVSKVTDFTNMFADTAFLAEVDGGYYFTACILHTSWKAQNPTHWVPQLAGLTVSDTFCAPYLSGVNKVCPPLKDQLTTVPTGAVLTSEGCYNVSQITSMYRVFYGAGSMDSLLEWDTSRVTSMQEALTGASSFNQPLAWDTSAVTSMYSMFNGASSFNQPLAFDTSAVTSMYAMFFGASSFNQPLTFNTSSATTLQRMFKGATAFDNILDFDTSSVISMHEMFFGASAFSQDLSHWNISSVTSFTNMFSGTRMAAEVNSNKHLTRPCMIHHSWKQQNAVWNPQTAGLPAAINDATCAPYLPGGALHGDPHLTFAHGGKADFRGCDGCLFNLLSTQDMSVNMRTRDAHFQLHGSEVHGSFVTDVYVAWRGGTGQWLNLTYSSDEVGDGNWGWNAVRATCGGRGIRTYPKSLAACGLARLTLDYSSLVLSLPEWTVRLGSRPVYDRIDGPHHRLDMSFVPAVDEHKLSVWPHGIIGQSFDGDGKPRSGAQDDYSTDHVFTKAMAEGAIEGDWRDYQVSEPFATAFRFSRFGASPGTTKPRDVSKIARWEGASPPIMAGAA